MKYKIDLKRFIIVLIVFGSLILLIRGCLFSAVVNDVPTDDDEDEYVKIDVRLLEADGSVSTIDLEEYLVGVVAGEMPASFETEALKAQAVAARTYAVKKIEVLGGNPCSYGDNRCADSRCCQAYRTNEQMRQTWGDEYLSKLDKIRDAVYSTSGVIITYDSMPIDALYHSSSGGYTENSENVFSSAMPYLVSVYSPDGGGENYRKQVKLSADEFVSKINRAFPKAKLKKSGLNSQVEVLSRFDSGRVETIKLGNTTATGRQFRTALSLNSAMFTISIDDEVTINTVGFGHGVGMSQYGANAMASSGSTYEEILTYYYYGVKLEKICS